MQTCKRSASSGRHQHQYNYPLALELETGAEDLHICTLAHSKESPAGAAVLALKDSQKTFHEEMLLLFEKELVASPHLFAKYEAPAEKNSGRIEKRTCWQTDYIGWFENIDEWYGLRSVIMVEAEIIHAMCKCASVEAPNGQSSAPVPVSERKAGAGNWCRPLMHLHICTLAHSKESPAGAGEDKARGGQPRVNPKDGALADRAVGEATEVRDQGREDVRGSVKGSEAGNADSVAHERRSPAPAFSTRLSLALGLPTSPWVVGARKGRLRCWCWTADRWKFAHLHICTLREVAACTASDHAALCALAQMRKP